MEEDNEEYGASDDDCEVVDIQNQIDNDDVNEVILADNSTEKKQP